MDALLTIDLSPGMRLLGPPAYTRGSGCSGSQTLSCDLDYVQAYQTTAIRLGVEITEPSYQSLHAAASSQGAPGYGTATFTVAVGA